MKTKLLKKLKKRFDWYFNQNKYPVLIDKKNKSVVVYNLEFCLNKTGYSFSEYETKVEVSRDEWALRIFKRDLLKTYGWTVNKSFYNKALTKLKSKKGV